MEIYQQLDLRLPGATSICSNCPRPLLHLIQDGIILSSSLFYHGFFIVLLFCVKYALGFTRYRAGDYQIMYAFSLYRFYLCTI